MEYSGAKPKVLTDLDSLVARNQASLLTLAFCLFAQAPTVMLYATGTLEIPLPQWCIALYVLLNAITFSYMVATYAHNEKLKAKRH